MPSHVPDILPQPYKMGTVVIIKKVMKLRLRGVL